MVHPNGTIGMQLKACGPLRYAYDDSFVVFFACCSRLTCIYIYGVILSHKFSGNNLTTPHKTGLTCPLNVSITFSAKFLWCIPDVTN